MNEAQVAAGQSTAANSEYSQRIALIKTPWTDAAPEQKVEKLKLKILDMRFSAQRLNSLDQCLSEFVYA